MINSASSAESVSQCDNLVLRMVDRLRKHVTLSDAVSDADVERRLPRSGAAAVTSMALCLTLTACGSGGGGAASTAEATQMKTTAVIGEITRSDTDTTAAAASRSTS